MLGCAVFCTHPQEYRSLISQDIEHDLKIGHAQRHVLGMHEQEQALQLHAEQDTPGNAGVAFKPAPEQVQFEHAAAPVATNGE